MSNPYTVSASTVFTYGPNGSTSDNIVSLPSGQAKGFGSTTVSPLPAADYLIAPIKITTGTVTAGANVAIYLLTSEDGSNWTGGMDPGAAGTDQSALLTAWLNASVPPTGGPPSRGAIQTILTPANATAYYFDWFCLSDLLTDMPSYWTILLQNNTGGALTATAAQNFAQYRAKTYL